MSLPCSFCGGSGVDLIFDVESTCPDCYGTGDSGATGIPCILAVAHGQDSGIGRRVAQYHGNLLVRLSESTPRRPRGIDPVRVLRKADSTAALMFGLLAGSFALCGDPVTDIGRSVLVGLAYVCITVSFALAD